MGEWRTRGWSLAGGVSVDQQRITAEVTEHKENRD